MTPDLQSRAGRFIRSPNGLVLLAFLAIAGFFLVTDHTAHVFGLLPYALLLCPLLHLVMHGGHGGHGGPGDGHAGHGDSQPPPAAGGGR